jgi:hypothetical protein
MRPQGELRGYLGALSSLKLIVGLQSSIGEHIHLRRAVSTDSNVTNGRKSCLRWPVRRMPQHRPNFGYPRNREPPFGAREGIIVRLGVATLSLSFLLLAGASVHAQAPPPAPPEASRPTPGIAQSFVNWLHHVAGIAPHRRERSMPPLPRPRPAELTATSDAPDNAPAAQLHSLGTQKPTAPVVPPAPAPDAPNKAPLANAANKAPAAELAPAPVAPNAKLAPASDAPNKASAPDPLND